MSSSGFERSFLRVVSLATLFAFLPSGIGIWEYLPVARIAQAQAPAESLATDVPLLTNERIEKLGQPSNPPKADGSGLENQQTKPDAEIGQGEASLEPILLANAASVAAAEKVYSDSKAVVEKEINPDAQLEQPKVLLARVDLPKLARAVSSDKQGGVAARFLVARPFVVKKDNPADTSANEPTSGSFVVQKQQGAIDAAGSPPDEAVQRLLDANSRLDARDYAGATADYVRLLDAFPKSAVAEATDSTLRDIARYAEEGGFGKEETLAIADQLPPFAELKDFRTKYWSIALTTALADSLTRADDRDTAKTYYEASHRVAREIMQQDKSDPHQIYLVRNYFKSARALGPEAERAADQHLEEILAAETGFNMLRLAAQAEYTVRNVQYNGGHIESAIRCGDILDEFPVSDAARALEDPAYGDTLKANLLYILASAYYNTAQNVNAAEVYKQIRDNYPEAGQVWDAAGYMHIFSLQQHEPADIDGALARYSAFLDENPKSVFVPKVLSECARLYVNVEDFDAAAQVLKNLAELFPESGLGQEALRAIEKLEQLKQDKETALEDVTQLSINLDVPRDAQLCGPVALRKLMLSEGVDVPLEQLAAATGADATGTSMLALSQAATESGLPLRGMEHCTVASLSAPYIAHLSDDHYVVVRENANGKVIVDDLDGVTEYTEAQFTELWSGRALVPVKHAAAGASMSPMAMAEVRGGTDDHVTELNEDSADCINADCPGPGCSSKFNASSTGAGLMGDGGAGTGAPGSPFAITNPGNPLGNGTPGGDENATGSPFGAPLAKSAGVDLRIGGTGHRSVRLQETDINVSSRGPLSLTFTRHYMNGWGRHNGYFTGAYQPYRQNMGEGWNHNLSAHLRPSSLNGMVFYIDPSGNSQEFLFDSAVGSISKYKKKHTQDEARTYDLAVFLERDGTTGKWTMEWPSGIKSGFSAPLGGWARYCRMEYVRDVNYDSGLDNEFLFEYDETNENVYGQLTKVTAPSGDDRYLQLSYITSNLSKVELWSGANLLRKAEYFYTNSGWGKLTKTRIDANSSTDVSYEYDTETNPGNVNDVATWISKVIDRNGHETDIDFEYASAPCGATCTMWVPNKVFVTNPRGLKTVFEKDGVWGSNKSIVRNYDGATALSKMQNDINWTSYFTEGYRYYTTPTGSTYDGWTYEWKNDRDLTKVKLGSTTMAQYTYTAAGRISTETIRGMSPRIYEYATATSLYPTRVVEPDGTATSYYYDTKDRVTKVVPPGVGSAGYTFTYDGYGQLITKANPDGSITCMEYNTRGYMNKITDNVGSYSTFAYDQLGNMTSMTNPLSQTTTLEYDYTGCVACGSGNGYLTKVIDPASNATTFEYDDNGNKTKAIDALSRVTTIAYDATNRPTKITDPAGDFSTMEYNLLGQMTKQTSPTGNISTLTYDYMGRVSTQTDGIGTTTYTYTTLGNISTVTDGNGHVWDYDYNAYGLLTRLTDPISKKTHYYYDAAQRVTKAVAGASATTDPVEYAFHATTGHMTQVTYTNGGNVNDATYYYDSLARMTQVDDWMGDAIVGEDGHFFEYDSLGRMTRYRDFDDDPSGTRKKLDYTYDALGRVLTMTDYEGYQTTYTYTNTGQISTITAPGSKVWDYDYNALQQRTVVTLPNGMTSNYSYDDRNRMTKIEHKNASTVKEGWSYKLADDGNILRMASAVSGSKQAWDYGYDDRNRLVDAIRTNESGVPQLRESYAYDAGDNMLTKDHVALDPVLFDDFADNDYTANPTWSVGGTWTAASGYLQYTSGGFLPSASIAQTEEVFDGWVSYYMADASAGKYLNIWLTFDGTVGENLEISGTQMKLKSIAGTDHDTNTAATTTAAQWYDLYFKVNGTKIDVWRGKQGEGLEKVLSTTSAVSITANTHFYMLASGNGGSRFDNFRIMKPRSTSLSFTDDFSDNNYTASPAWTVHAGTWSAASGYLQNTAAPSIAPAVRQDFAHRDFTAKYRFRINSSGTTSADPRTSFIFRGNSTGTTNRIQAEFMKATNQLRLGQWASGTFSALVSNTSLTIAYDTDYDVQVVADGRHIEVWWAQAGNEMTKIAETDSATVLQGERIQLVASSDTVDRYDNIEFMVADPVTSTYTYNDGNELLTMVKGSATTTFTYDDWGRQVSKIVGGNNAFYQYRYGSMLKRIDSTIPGEADLVQYIYDGLMKRREIKMTDNSVVIADDWNRYDLGFNAIASYDVGANGSTAWDIGIRTQTVTYRGMTPLAEVPGSNPSSGSYRHYFHDHLGSTRALYDGSKTLLARVAYESYGEQASSTAGVKAGYTYTGKTWEDETQMYFFPYRYYAPDRARWITRDPLGMVDGPNSYQYAISSPISMLDRYGLATDWCSILYGICVFECEVSLRAENMAILLVLIPFLGVTCAAAPTYVGKAVCLYAASMVVGAAYALAQVKYRVCMCLCEKVLNWCRSSPCDTQGDCAPPLEALKRAAKKLSDAWKKWDDAIYW
jgi:RHS repeat-associated protein